MQTARILLVYSAILGGCVREDAQHKAAGNILFRNGDMEGAVREYDTAVQKNPTDPEARVLRANALFEQERYDRARADFAKAAELMPKATSAYRGLAKVALRQGDSPAAEMQLRTLLEYDPRDHEALRDLAALRARASQLEEAERLLRGSLAIVGNDVRTLYALAIIEARRGKVEHALATAATIEAAAPERAISHYIRATVMALQGKTEEALAHLQRAIDRGVDDISKIASDENLASLRDDPRFYKLVESPRAAAVRD